MTVVVIFGLIPILELFISQDDSNLDTPTRELKATKIFFDWLLYINIPLVYGVLFYYLYSVSSLHLELYELIGMTFSTGITLSTNGINVAHELGHRKSQVYKWMSKALLLPSMYTHFIIEHNLGHHKHVATELDPASAEKGQNIYGFWLRSLIGGYSNAWKIENKRMEKTETSFFSLRNEMLVLSVIQLVFVVLIYAYFGFSTLIWFFISALVSVLLLETINYIEHYGLRRVMIDGRYERVRPEHSWNSNHEIGRILLYELTRHSDHHFNASKKYQLLDHHGTARQLPLGYPGSMIVSLLPPVWYKLMNQRI